MGASEDANSRSDVNESAGADEVWKRLCQTVGLGFLFRCNEVYEPRAKNLITFFPLADENISGCSLVPCQNYLAVGVTPFPIAVIAMICRSVGRFSADRHDVAISFDFNREARI